MTTTTTTTKQPESEYQRHPEKTSGNSFLGDVWTNFLRWNLKKVREPFVLVFALVQPIIFLVLFSQVFGKLAGRAVPGGDYLAYLVPAIVIQVALITAAGSGTGFVQDIESGMFEKTLASPMSRTAVFTGKILSDLLLIVVPTLIMLGLGYVLGTSVTTGLLGVVGILGVALVFSVWFMAFSNVLGIVTGDVSVTGIATNLIQFPLLFASTAFVPVDALPGWLQVVSSMNPVTYGIDAARAIMLSGWTWGVIGQSLVVLVALDLLFGAIAVYFLGRASSSAAW
ncbi:ABC transporter permease [Haladaptatus sp. AB643]|uniref:ABC transporter permease n=1 Tax=Haladaptatus sp. AB643 TaxID=2934174 RepID=UPI00209C0216|nr:ABC transporter permease [Haladaptatus sp. AB643]MCO8245326.1 ABC transporter permease [Haladaptatus sp. AB643]